MVNYCCRPPQAGSPLAWVVFDISINIAAIIYLICTCDRLIIIISYDSVFVVVFVLPEGQLQLDDAVINLCIY